MDVATATRARTTLLFESVLIQLSFDTEPVGNL
jgi:hypothetical protein